MVALPRNEALMKGLNTIDGKLTNEAVATSLDMEYTPYIGE